MFGIIMIVVAIIYMTYKTIENGIDDYNSKKRYRNNTFGTYIDHDGLSRDLKTNKYKSVSREHNGDIYIWTNETGNINYSQMQREKEYERYKHEYDKGVLLNRTTIYWNPSPHYDSSKKVNILGKRYKDIESGKILIVREHNHKYYYVVLDTMKVLRYTDSCIRNLKKRNKYSQEKEIEDVKSFQEIIYHQLGDSEYIGDPTKGRNCLNTTSQLEDYWKEK